MRRVHPPEATLGMRFYTGKMFPKEYQEQIFIAEHGSWNRGQKDGYRIELVTLSEKGDVDVLVMPDGALLVSDDERGAVYRISYSKKSK